MEKKNFLLGKGERLTDDVRGVSGGGPKSAPYTFSEAKSRLLPMLSAAANEIEGLHSLACPNDEAVLSLTLNPEYCLLYTSDAADD